MALISTEKEHASGRIVCIVAGVLATCSVGPILGYNVYVDAFKAHFKLSQVTGWCTVFLSVQQYNIKQPFKIVADTTNVNFVKLSFHLFNVGIKSK